MDERQHSASESGKKARAYRITPPADVLADPERLRRWRPKRLTVRQGIAETAIPVLAGYAAILVILAIYSYRAWVVLPDLIEVLQFFGASTAVYSKTVFLTIAYAIQVLLIYLDLIRRTRSRYLLLVPLLYFFLVIYIVSSL